MSFAITAPSKTFILDMIGLDCWKYELCIVQDFHSYTTGLLKYVLCNYRNISSSKTFIL